MTAAKVRRLLRAYLKKNKLTQTQFGKLVGCNRTFICNVLAGRRPPTDRILRRLGLKRMTFYVSRH